MTETGLLEHILERLGRSEAAQELFGADEVEDWPPGALDTLIKLGLLRPAEPAQVIECKSCEENCAMPVYTIPAEGKRPARAFISCDKREDVGRVPVDRQRLLQWQITGGMLAKAVGQLLRCAQPVGLDTEGKFWRLGLLKDEGYSSQVTLAIEDGVSLKMVDHDLPLDLPLAEMLVLDQNGVRVDRARLVPFAGKPVMAPSVVEPPEPSFLFRRNRTGTWEILDNRLAPST